MSFDRTNPVHLLALQTEVNTDPALIGYNPNGNTNTDILDKLNLPENNTGLETGVAPLTAGKLWEIIADDSATATQFEFNLSNLFAMVDTPDTDVSDFRDGVVGLGDSQVNAGITANTRPLNRAEVLFGGVEANGNAEVVTISRDDWFAARDYTA